MKKNPLKTVIQLKAVIKFAIQFALSGVLVSSGIGVFDLKFWIIVILFVAYTEIDRLTTQR